MPKNATRPSQDKHENGAYLFPEIDDPAFEEAMTSAIAKIMADSSDLSKAAPGEQLEYLTPGEKPPGETPVRTTQRGARGYYPSEVAGGEEEAPAAVAEEPEDVELPEEEREVEAVQPSDINEPQEELFDPDVDDQYENELIDKLLKLEESGDLQAVFEELYPDQDWSELDAGDERILGDEEGLPNKDWRNLLENIEAIRPSIPEDLQRRQDFREWNSKIDEEGNPKGINVLQKFNEGGQGYVKRIIAGTQVPKNMDSHMMQPRDYFNQLEELPVIRFSCGKNVAPDVTNAKEDSLLTVCAKF